MLMHYACKEKTENQENIYIIIKQKLIYVLVYSIFQHKSAVRFNTLKKNVKACLINHF